MAKQKSQKSQSQDPIDALQNLNGSGGSSGNDTPGIDLDALANLDLGLDAETQKILKETSDAGLRVRHPFINDNKNLTENHDDDPRASKGHLVKLLDWVPNFESKRQGKGGQFEKLDMEIIEPDDRVGAQCKAGERYTLLLRKGTEIQDKQADKIRGAMCQAIATAVNGSPCGPDETKRIFGMVYAAMKAKKLPAEVAEKLLMRVHIGFDRNNSNKSKTVALDPSVYEKFGGEKFIPIPPGSPNLSKYGTPFIHARISPVTSDA